MAPPKGLPPPKLTSFESDMSNRTPFGDVKNHAEQHDRRLYDRPSDAEVAAGHQNSQVSNGVLDTLGTKEDIAD